MRYLRCDAPSWRQTGSLGKQGPRGGRAGVALRKPRPAPQPEGARPQGIRVQVLILAGDDDPIFPRQGSGGFAHRLHEWAPVTWLWAQCPGNLGRTDGGRRRALAQQVDDGGGDIHRCTMRRRA